jgi:hypothetical protein
VNHMRRASIAVGVSLMLMAFAATSVLGASQGAHYNSGPTVSVTGNTLSVDGKAAGLGNIGAVDISLTGTVTVNSRCYTKSNNKPQAANKQENINVDQSGTFAARNGSVTFHFEVTPLSTLSCPPGQRVVVESATYNLNLTWPSYPTLNRNLTGSF